MDNEPTITKQMLLKADARTDIVQRFEQMFGDSVTVTVAGGEKVASLFSDSWGWAGLNLLHGDEWVKFNRTWAAKLGSYRHALPTREEYHRAHAVTFAEAFIAMHKRKAK